MSDVPSNVPVTRAELEAAIREATAQIRATMHRRFSPESLAWLALVPGWTKPLAQECDFPTGERTLDEFLHQAAESGYCEQRSGTDPAGKPVLEFWMPEAVRAEVLADMRSRPGAVFLSEALGSIARKLRRAAGFRAFPGGSPEPRFSGGLEAAPASLFDAWLELASLAEKSLDLAADRLQSEIERHVAGNDSGLALVWLRAGEGLARALGGQFDAAIVRGRHLTASAYRQVQDERHLRCFLERAEQTAAFHELINGPDEFWALHFLGMGGVGKTMLIRHLTARLAPREGRFVARIDFDYISPHYPARQPDQLLVELADPLRAHSDPSLYDGFHRAVATLRERLSGTRAEGGDPLAALAMPEFKAVCRAFVDWLKALRSPVVLILDTCEELAKVHPGGQVPPSVLATFQILKQLHEEVPSLRAIFSGRRLLALSGYGWEVNNARLPEASRRLPARVSFLRLHEIRGFDEPEADEFFTRAGVRLDAPLRRAVLQRSRETGMAADIKVAPNPRREGDRYNPFDVALYLDWLREDPGLTAHTIATGRTDPYVEMRIVRRLKPEVRNLLPAVVLLGRFDQSMLRAAAAVRDAAFDDLYHELAEQEWTDYQTDQALQTVFLEVDKKLYPRLIAYFQADAAQRALLEDAQARLAPALERLVLERPLGRLSVDHVLTSLRLLPAQRAAALWDELDRRVTEEANWNWAAAVTSRLLSDEGELAALPLDRRLRAGLLATHTAVTIHLQPGSPEIRQNWEDIQRETQSYPNPAKVTELFFRAEAGRIAASPAADADVLALEAQSLRGLWGSPVEVISPWLGPQDRVGSEAEQAALLAATEALLEKAEGGNLTARLPVESYDRMLQIAADGAARHGIDLKSLPQRHDRTLSAMISLPLAAMTFTLAARGLALHQRWSWAAKAFAAAEACLPTASESATQRWADWVAPASLRDRVRLERLRYLTPEDRVLDASTLLAWQRDAEPRQHLIDSERLMSGLLQWHLARGPVSHEELEKLTAAYRYDPDRRPTCQAHRLTPPLFVTLTLGWLALGDARKALALADPVGAEALQNGRDPDTVRAAEQVRWRVIRRMRLHSLASIGASRIAANAEMETFIIGWPALVLNGMEDVTTIIRDDPWFHHSLWCGSRRPEAEPSRLTQWLEAESPGDFLPGDAPARLPSFLRAMLELDWREAELLGAAGSRRATTRNLSFDPAAWLKAHPLETEAAARLMLRAHVLLGTPDLAVAWAPQVGARRLGEVALEEGELLARRLPDRALPLLALGWNLFESVNDSAGVVLAGILTVITEFHRGDAPSVRSRLPELENRLQSVRSRLEGELKTALPGGGAAAGDAPGDSSALDHPSWGGWVLRWVRCLAYADQLRTGEPHEPLWLVQRYPENLPAELAFATAGRVAAVAAASPAPRLGWMDGALRGIAWLMVIGMPLLFLVGSWWLSGFRLFGPSRPGETTASILFVILTLSLVGGAAIYAVLAVLRILRARRTGRERVEISIETTGPPSDRWVETQAGGPATMHLRMQHVARGFPLPGWKWKPPITVSGSTRTPGRQTAAAVADLPSAIVTELKRSQSCLTGRSSWTRLPVRLRVAAGVEAFAWEGLFRRAVRAVRPSLWTRAAQAGAQLVLLLWAGGASAVCASLLFRSDWEAGQIALTILIFLPAVALIFLPWRVPGKELEFYRAGQPLLDWAFREKLWRRAREVHAVVGPSWTLLVEEGWRPPWFLLPFRLLRRPTRLSISDRKPASGPRRVLHLIGTAVWTSAGVRLQVSIRPDELALRTQSDVIADRLGQVLPGPEQLGLDTTALVVIQGEPTNHLGASESERTQVAGLRVCGAELLAAGAQAVLVLPPLPPSLGQSVLRRLTASLSGLAEPDPRRLVGVVLALRDLIARWKPPVAWLRKTASNRPDLAGLLQDLSLDVTLFARPKPGEALDPEITNHESAHAQ